MHNFFLPLVYYILVHYSKIVIIYQLIFTLLFHVLHSVEESRRKVDNTMAKIKWTNNDLTQKPVNNTMAKIKGTNNNLTQKPKDR